jgi:polyhydroxybutyrate depolymerase
MRQFVMYLPDGLMPDAPMVVLLHGYGAGIRRDNIMIAPADRHGFAVCIPQALKDPKGEPSWNVGYAFQQGWKVDDVKALCTIAREAQKRYHLSRRDAFLTGMSNGGEMCYLMAYSNQYTFRAVAPIAGLTMAWTYEQMEATRPIPLMEIHGTEDRVSEWTGDLKDAGGWGAYLPVPLAIGYWVAKNRCTQEVTERVESLKGNEGHPIIKHCYSSPTTHCAVWLYEVVGGVHSWHTDDIDTGEEIWQFFSRYTK